MKFPLGWLLFNKWLWITIFCASLIVVGPLIVVSILLALPPWLRGIGTLMLILGWSVAGGYKDWVIARRQEQRMKFRTSEYFHEENLR